MTKLLENIDSPSDLKKLKASQLFALADELRQEMIYTVQITGGHLASSLGVVELTIALHRVFNAPIDKIIWDVGHQAYAHKLLTSRRGLFATQRQHEGISGFPVREESPYDPFGTGHASTSISAALGIASARDFNKEKYNVVAVIGDGSIGGGMALEALNNTGASDTKIIIVLNDNGMSISPTVGEISKILRKVRFNRHYYHANEKGKRILRAIPLGKLLLRLGGKIKHSMKGFFLSSTLWEDLGLAYMGPIDGHDIPELESAFRQARDYEHKAVLVHIVTTKGKGYEPAEDDAVCFHGISPKGVGTKTTLMYSEVFAQSTLEIMRQDPSVVVITAAMPEGNCLVTVQNEFPQRVIDVGICEQHAVTFAAGLATQGIRPIVAIYSTFLQRSFDQIIHDVCLQKLPVSFAIDRGGIVGDDGKTHQGLFDLSYLSLIPDMIVAAPKDENELKHLLYTAVYCGKPMAVRYSRGIGTGTPLDDCFHTIPVGKGELVREGKDVALVGVGITVAVAQAAAEILSKQGVGVAVVNARFASPLDKTLLIETAKRCRRIVTIEENVLSGGFGSAVLALFEQHSLHNVIVHRIGIPDIFVEHGLPATLRAKYGLDAGGVVRQVMEFFPEMLTSQPANVTPR